MLVFCVFFSLNGGGGGVGADCASFWIRHWNMPVMHFQVPLKIIFLRIKVPFLDGSTVLLSKPRHWLLQTIRWLYTEVVRDNYHEQPK